jgi:hypothetical protein
MEEISGLSLLEKLETNLRDQYGEGSDPPAGWEKYPLTGSCYAESVSDGCYNENSPIASSDDVHDNIINKFYRYYETLRDLLEKNFPAPDGEHRYFKIVIEPCWEDTSAIVIFDYDTGNLLYQYDCRPWHFVWNTPDEMAQSMKEDYDLMVARIKTPPKQIRVKEVLNV